MTVDRRGVLGHGAILARLWGALERGTLHHALLFEGPVGVGKHTVAVRLAQAANCTGAPPHPCGTCPACHQIALGSYPDVVTLSPDPDKATPTITVDQIREVVRQVGYHRYAGRRRMILVDPTEAMQPGAANALLKTLEEPPAGTGFVLIANHASALLPTIVSRCQRHRFGPVPEAELAAWLQAKGHAEPVRLARLSLGCPGRALELAEGRLGDREKVRDALVAAVTGDLPGLFAFSEKVCQGAARQEWMTRVEAVLEVLEDLLRDVVVRGAGHDAPSLHDDVPEVVERWTAALWPTGVVTIQRAIDEARENLIANVSGRTILDALLARVRTELGA